MKFMFNITWEDPEEQSTIYAVEAHNKRHAWHMLLIQMGDLLAAVKSIEYIEVTEQNIGG